MNRTRHGGIFKMLLVLVVVGSLGAFTWATITNSHRLGQWSCHPLDADWWMLSNPAGSQDPASQTTLVEDAKRLAAKAEDQLWGSGGLIERCEGWWQSQLSRHVETAPGASQDRRQYEQRFADAEAAFRSGLDAYKRAVPHAHGSFDDKRAAAAEAKTHFQRTSELLTANIPPYEALADHDTSRAHAAHQLLDYDRQLLELVAAP